MWELNRNSHFQVSTRPSESESLASASAACALAIFRVILMHTKFETHYIIKYLTNFPLETQIKHVHIYSSVSSTFCSFIIDKQ